MFAKPVKIVAEQVLSQWSGLRKAFDLRYPYMRSVYVRAVILTPESDEIKVTRLLAQHRNHPSNFAVRELEIAIARDRHSRYLTMLLDFLGTLDIFEYTHEGVEIALLVQEDAGEPCYLFPHLFREEQVWRKFVLHCFEVHNAEMAIEETQANFHFHLHRQ